MFLTLTRDTAGENFMKLGNFNELIGISTPRSEPASLT